MSRKEKITALRSLIEGQFGAPPRPTRSHLATGVGALDQLLEGGLCKGALLEITSSHPTSGASLFQRALLRENAAQGRWAALIDGSDAFDPAGIEPAVLTRLLWVRCQQASEAMRSADLLLRDGNLPLLLLDLRGLPTPELRRIPNPNWYRLQRTLEASSMAMVAFTPSPMICCAEVRLNLENTFSLATLEEESHELLAGLQFALTRKRQGQLAVAS